MTNLRIGQGIDVHPYDRTRPLYLGGVLFEGEIGLAGHSDADALLHAVIDAVLGAAGRPDIGNYFPPSDPQWKGARSTELLRLVMQELRGEGWRVVNCDCTVLAEVPRIQRHVPAMKKVLAELLGVDEGACGIKATTTEHLGFVGRREGLCACAVVLIERDERFVA